jgi:hypothetical protein
MAGLGHLRRDPRIPDYSRQLNFVSCLRARFGSLRYGRVSPAIMNRGVTTKLDQKF